MKKILLSSAYLGPIHYYTKFVEAEAVCIEQHDHYHKQTYRNRCRVLAGNGPIDLIIPIVKNSGVKTSMKEVEIEYMTSWQDKHWRTIVSAYNSSPFFEYYKDDIQPFYEKKWKYLFDLNNELNNVLLDLLEIEVDISYSESFIREFDGEDFRAVITPKKEGVDKSFQAESYTQTFGERFAFQPNLSIIDLLFNKGPEAYTTLESSIVR